MRRRGPASRPPTSPLNLSYTPTPTAPSFVIFTLSTRSLVPLNVNLVLNVNALFLAQLMQGHGWFISADGIPRGSHTPGLRAGGSQRLPNQMVIVAIHRYPSGPAVG